MRNLSGFLDFSLAESIIHLFFLSFFFVPHRAYRKNQCESSSPATSNDPSIPAPAPPPYTTSVILRVVHGGLSYVYQYLLLARAALFLAFDATQRIFANLTRTSP